MHHLLLSAQAWWDAQRFDQPVWQVAAWRDQKVRHIHLHVAKALGKVVALLDAEASIGPDTDSNTRIRDEVLPDMAIYRSQLINLLPDGCELPLSLGHRRHHVGMPEAAPLWQVMLGLSRASAALAAYLEPREHGGSSSLSHLYTAIENLHASAVALSISFEMDLTQAHRTRLEALLGASIPVSLMAT